MKCKTIGIIGFIFFICMFGCDGCLDSEYGINIQNNSTQSIILYSKIYGDDFYPDTTISFQEKSLYVNNKVPSGRLGYHTIAWEPVDKYLSSLEVDTFSFFIFSVDTIDYYFWEQIQEDYNILKRYDLTLEDLKLLDYKLTYPPSIQMRYMKMYPPFEE